MNNYEYTILIVILLGIILISILMVRSHFSRYRSAAQSHFEKSENCIKDGEECRAGDICCSTGRCLHSPCPPAGPPVGPPSHPAGPPASPPAGPPSPPVSPPESGKKKEKAPRLPNPIQGYYFWSWSNGNPPQKIAKGPAGSNIGITFPGAKASGQNGAWLAALNFKGTETANQINLLSIGGGIGSDGDQSFNKKDVTAVLAKLDHIKNYCGYSGICFDIESGNAEIEDYKTLFSETKSNGLIVMVTISYFATDQSHDGLGSEINDLVQNVFTNSKYVDILSPQLYSSDCDDGANWPVNAGGDFDGDGPTDATRNAYKKCEFLAPTINSNNWDVIKEKWSNKGLPKPIGYFQYCNKYV
jgi:hypothetical protein